MFASQRMPTWDRALRFPYPNGPKLREMIVLGPRDLALLRASAGRIAGLVDRRLTDRAFGYRTERSGSLWRFHDIRGAGWKRFTEAAVRLLERGDINAMCATDIASYYASIELDRLETRLHDIGCDLHAVAVILSRLRNWAFVDRVAGLPIGPEASGVLGNAFLIPVDRMLMCIGAEHVRWMDDYKIMGRDERECRSIVNPFDQILRTQGLTRSEGKTFYYDSSHSAIAALRDAKLDSLGFSLGSEADGATHELRAAFERDVAGEREVSRSRFRFILKRLKTRRDDYAAMALAGNPDLANIDPKASAEYLTDVALTTPAVVDEMFGQLGRHPDDGTDALDLHFLRALAGRPGEWGTQEGDLFASIAESESRRAPVRCWAVKAFSRTSRCRQGRLMESAEAETDSLVRRIKLTTLTRMRPGRKRNEFLGHMCDKFPDLTSTATWLRDAA